MASWTLCRGINTKLEKQLFLHSHMQNCNINGQCSAALYLEPLLLFHISFVRLSFVAFASILLILADTLNVVLVVIAPV